MPNMSGAKYYNINVACLDDVDIDELMAAPVRYYDGLNDNWGSAPVRDAAPLTTVVARYLAPDTCAASADRVASASFRPILAVTDEQKTENHPWVLSNCSLDGTGFQSWD